MSLKRITTILLLSNLIALILSGPLQLWSYEYLEFNTYTSDPSKIDLEGKIARVSRGQYGITASGELKIDLYDDTLVSPTVERSLSREGPYTKLPLVTGNYTLSMAMNLFWKSVVQPSMNCCTNAPIVTGRFKPPLTKRRMVCKDCYVITDNLPNILMEGYYRIRITFYGPFVAYGETISYIWPKL